MFEKYSCSKIKVVSRQYGQGTSKQDRKCEN